MILVDYRACGHILEIPRRDQREEIERAAAGQPCPQCRAQLDKPMPRPAPQARSPTSCNGVGPFSQSYYCTGF